jgi:hypothetical protein
MPTQEKMKDKIQNLYEKLEGRDMGDIECCCSEILEFLRECFPAKAEIFFRFRADKKIAMPIAFEIATYLVMCKESLYQLDVALAGLRREQKKNEELRQLRLKFNG